MWYCSWTERNDLNGGIELLEWFLWLPEFQVDSLDLCRYQFQDVIDEYK